MAVKFTHSLYQGAFFIIFVTLLYNLNLHTLAQDAQPWSSGKALASLARGRGFEFQLAHCGNFFSLKYIFGDFFIFPLYRHHRGSFWHIFSDFLFYEIKYVEGKHLRERKKRGVSKIFRELRNAEM